MIEVAWDTYINNIYNLISILKYKNNFKYIYGIPRGGLIPATIISYEFNKPLIFNIDRLSNIEKKELLIVDDIFDSGGTLNNYLNQYPESKSACIYLRYELTSYKNILLPDYHSKVINNGQWIKFPYENKEIEDTISKVKKHE